jgi:hypothetical protein
MQPADDSSFVPNPRTVLAVMLTALLVTAAGCGGLLGDDGSSSEGARLDSVPDRADAVFYMDVEGILESDAHRGLANTVFEEFANTSDSYEGPGNVDEAQEEAENTSGVDAGDIQEVTGFSASTESGEYSGAIVESSLSESEFVTAQAENQEYNFSEDEYNGHTFYSPSSEPDSGNETYIGVLEDGVYVTGTEEAVRDVIDTVDGEMDPISGEVRTAYEETRDGLVRFASSVPQDEIPTDAANGSVPIDTQVFASVSLVSGSHYVADETVGLNLNLDTDSESSAADVRDATDGAVSLASAYLTNDQAQDQLRKINVSSEGSTVTVEYGSSVSSLEELIRTYVQLLAGSESET